MEQNGQHAPRLEEMKDMIDVPETPQKSRQASKEQHKKQGMQVAWQALMANNEGVNTLRAVEFGSCSP